MPLVSFYTTWKHQKSKGFLIHSKGIERLKILVAWNGLIKYCFTVIAFSFDELFHSVLLWNLGIKILHPLKSNVSTKILLRVLTNNSIVTNVISGVRRNLQEVFWGFEKLLKISRVLSEMEFIHVYLHAEGLQFY